MPNLDNLKPFTKGSKEAIEAGKKSKRRSFDKKMRDWLESPAAKAVLGSKDGKELLTSLGVEECTVEDLFRYALLIHGVKGNIKAIQESLDRAYGKARQTIDHRAEITIHEETKEQIEKAAKALKEFDE